MVENTASLFLFYFANQWCILLLRQRISFGLCVTLQVGVYANIFATSYNVLSGNRRGWHRWTLSTQIFNRNHWCKTGAENLNLWRKRLFIAWLPVGEFMFKRLFCRNLFLLLLLFFQLPVFPPFVHYLAPCIIDKRFLLGV